MMMMMMMIMIFVSFTVLSNQSLVFLIFFLNSLLFVLGCVCYMLRYMLTDIACFFWGGVFVILLIVCFC